MSAPLDEALLETAPDARGGAARRAAADAALPIPRLMGIATSVPPHRIEQAQVTAWARKLFAESRGDIERLLPAFANAGIEARHCCAPLDWFDQARGWAEKNALFLDAALEMMVEATAHCLERTGVAPETIDALVTVSTSGIATPSLCSRLIEKLDLRRDTARLPIFGLGCAGGVLGLARAAEMARARPGERVLVLVVETCTITFRRADLSKSNVIATALFGDGCAAALLSTEGDGAPLTAWGEHSWPDSLGVMGWNVADDGLGVVFSRDIPNLVRQDMRAACDRFLDRAGMALGDIRHFACHPGGAKVIAALEECFDQELGAFDDSRAVLREFGNMSSVTALFVLDRLRRRGAQGTTLMSALGPGFSAGFLTLDL